MIGIRSGHDDRISHHVLHDCRAQADLFDDAGKQLIWIRVDAELHGHVRFAGRSNQSNVGFIDRRELRHGQIAVGWTNRRGVDLGPNLGGVESLTTPLAIG